MLLSLASDYYYEYTWGSGAFAVCTALLTMAVVVFYVITTLIFKKSRVARPLVHAIMDSICWLFWLASFAAIAGTQDTLLWDFSYSEVYALIGLGVIEWFVDPSGDGVAHAYHVSGFFSVLRSS